ncbi:hypothetical protein APP_03370 [Aeribacillus pallidus]|nr:hypothetical protein APP_03370 [Aeribacillus pallidus]
MKFKKMLLFAVVLLLLSGCWNRRELNTIAIQVGLGIDKEGDQYVVTSQIVNPSQIAMLMSKGDKTPVMTYQEKGHTIIEAIRRMTTAVPRRIYSSHLRILVIGEELAKEGIGEVLDLLSRDHEMRTDFYITVAKDAKAGDILKVLTALEDIPANQLFNSLELSDKQWALTISVTLDQLLSDLSSEGIEVKLTGISVEGNQQVGETKANYEQIDPEAKLKFKGIALFHQDRLIGWLDEQQSRALHYIIGKVHRTIEEISCKNDGKISIDIFSAKSQLKTKMHKGNPVGEVHIEAQGNVADVQCKNLTITNTKTIRKIEKKTEEKIKQEVEKVLSNVQQNYRVDAFGFGKALYRDDYKNWKKIKKHWKETFTELPIKTTVDVKIRRTGTINNPPLNKLED